jgi:DNA-binding Lrp family transcriptional regulator
MASVKVSESELLEALKSAVSGHENPDDAHTVVEIAAAMGASRPLTCERLLRLKKAGLIEVVRVERERLDGGRSIVPAYRFLNRKRTKKGKRAA